MPCWKGKGLFQQSGFGQFPTYHAASKPNAAGTPMLLDRPIPKALPTFRQAFAATCASSMTRTKICPDEGALELRKIQHSNQPKAESRGMFVPPCCVC